MLGTFSSPPSHMDEVSSPLSAPRPLVCTPGGTSFGPPLFFRPADSLPIPLQSRCSSLPSVLGVYPVKTWSLGVHESWNGLQLFLFCGIILLLLILLFVLEPVPSITISLFISFWPTEDFSECFHCPTDKPWGKKIVLRWRHESPRRVIWYKSVQPRFLLSSAIDFEIQTKKKGIYCHVNSNP